MYGAHGLSRFLSYRSKCTGSPPPNPKADFVPNWRPALAMVRLLYGGGNRNSWITLIFDTYNKLSNNSLINRLLIVNGSWLMAQGTWLMPQGSLLKAHGSWPRKFWRWAPQAPGPRIISFFLGHEP